MTLQQRFIQSNGLPVVVGNDSVFQMDRLPIKDAQVVIKFITQNEDWGIALKSSKGSIILEKGEKVKLLHIWSDPKYEAEVSYDVKCPDGELKVWNIYKTRHSSGFVTVDQWTYNSGMILVKETPSSRLYSACCEIGPFSPNFQFEISWKEKLNQTKKTNSSVQL